MKMDAVCGKDGVPGHYCGHAIGNVLVSGDTFACALTGLEISMH